MEKKISRTIEIKEYHAFFYHQKLSEAPQLSRGLRSPASCFCCRLGR